MLLLGSATATCPAGVNRRDVAGKAGMVRRQGAAQQGRGAPLVSLENFLRFPTESASTRSRTCPIGNLGRDVLSAASGGERKFSARSRSRHSICPLEDSRFYNRLSDQALAKTLHATFGNFQNFSKTTPEKFLGGATSISPGPCLLSPPRPHAPASRRQTTGSLHRSNL